MEDQGYLLQQGHLLGGMWFILNVNGLQPGTVGLEMLVSDLISGYLHHPLNVQT